MKLLHLITAVHVDLSQHMGDTARSVDELRAALAPRGWTVAWHVVVDGVGELGAEPAGADTLIHLGRHVGVSTARNRALTATRGLGWVFRLDGDDEVDVAGWCALVDDPAFGSTQWHATNTLNFDGHPGTRWFSQPRLWAVREVQENWVTPMVFLPGNIVCRADLALAAGGWAALRVVEDVAWCFRVNELEAGLALPYGTCRVRKWDKQTTGEDAFVADKDSAYAFLAASTNARRAREGLPPVYPPTLPPEPSRGAGQPANRGF